MFLQRNHFEVFIAYTNKLLMISILRILSILLGIISLILAYSSGKANQAKTVLWLKTLAFTGTMGSGVFIYYTFLVLGNNEDLFSEILLFLGALILILGSGFFYFKALNMKKNKKRSV